MLINVPDTLPKALVQQRIEELEERLKQDAQQSQKPASRWEKMRQRIESKAFDLEDHTDTFNRDRQAFRESFNFSADKIYKDMRSINAELEFEDWTI